MDRIREMFLFFESTDIAEWLAIGFCISFIQKKSSRLDFKSPYLLVIFTGILYLLCNYWLTLLRTHLPLSTGFDYGLNFNRSGLFYREIIFVLLHLAAFCLFNRALQSWFKRFLMAFPLLLICEVFSYAGFVVINLSRAH